MARKAFIITDVKWGQDDAPQWTISEAMRTLSLLDVRYRENGYALTLHGSVLVSGKGNDLDLIAVPMEVAVTPPEEMERIMCELLDATPVPVEPRLGLLRTWARACTLADGHQIDIEYRRPAPSDRQTSARDPLIAFFWENGYHLEVCSLPSRFGEAYLDLLAVPVRPDATLPEHLGRAIRERFQAQLDPDFTGTSACHRVYDFDGQKIAIRYCCTPP